MFRSITNDGLPAKFVVLLRKQAKTGSVTIYKTLFSRDNNALGIKRKWKDLYFCQEIIVLKLETTLAIAQEVAKFMKEHA